MSRYVIDGPWAIVDRFAARPADTTYRIDIETADLIDTRTGHKYSAGARRVRVSPSYPGARTRVFKGETAWSRADNYARDLQYRISLNSERV